MTAISIDDLLSVAGEVPLATFEWGQGLIETTNMLMGPTHGLNGLLTGKQAREVVRMLPSDVLMRVLTVRVDLKTGRLAQMPTQATDVAPASPVVTPAAVTGPRVVNPNLLPLGAIVVVMALFLLAFTVSSIKGTPAPDTVVLEKVMGAIVEISRESAKPAQAPAPAPEPAPPP